jgi:hypothetical protein
MQWSSAQTYKILNDSPWVKFAPAGFRSVQEPLPIMGGSVSTQANLYRSFYRVSLLTARPMREALLRLYSLSSMLVDANNYDPSQRVQREEARLRRFMESSPNDVRVKGDEHFIILGLTSVISVQRTTWGEAPRMSPEQWNIESQPEELLKTDIPSLMNNATLGTNTGRRAALFRYEPPGPDRLGGKFYFPRILPDGEPLVMANDKELIFEAPINKRKIRARLDLRKMVLMGKLEM